MRAASGSLLELVDAQSVESSADLARITSAFVVASIDLTVGVEDVVAPALGSNTRPNPTADHRQGKGKQRRRIG